MRPPGRTANGRSDGTEWSCDQPEPDRRNASVLIHRHRLALPSRHARRADPRVGTRVRAGLAARRRTRRGHRDGVPRAAGDGVRRAGRRTSRGRPVGGGRRTDPVRRPGLEPPAQRRPREHDGADDRGRHRGRGDGRQGGGRCSAGVPRRGVLRGRLAAAARGAGGPAEQAGARRVPRRHRRDHGRLAAGQAARDQRGRGRVLQGDLAGPQPSEPSRHSHSDARAHHPGGPPHRQPLLPARTREPGRHAGRHRGGEAARPPGPRRPAGRRHPRGHPDARLPGRHRLGPGRDARAGAGHRLRRLHRQHPHRPRVRGEAPRDRRTPTRAGRPRARPTSAPG